MPQPPRAWRWTRKVGGKIASLGLTPGKAEKMKQAIANHRALDKVIDEMREITQKLILETPESAPISRRKNHPNPALTYCHSCLTPIPTNERPALIQGFPAPI